MTTYNPEHGVERFQQIKGSIEDTLDYSKYRHAPGQCSFKEMWAVVQSIPNANYGMNQICIDTLEHEFYRLLTESDYAKNIREQMELEAAWRLWYAEIRNEA